MKNSKDAFTNLCIHALVVFVDSNRTEVLEVSDFIWGLRWVNFLLMATQFNGGSIGVFHYMMDEPTF